MSTIKQEKCACPRAGNEDKAQSSMSKMDDVSGRLQRLTDGVSANTWSLAKCTLIFFLGVLLTKKMQKVVNEML